MNVTKLDPSATTSGLWEDVDAQGTTFLAHPRLPSQMGEASDRTDDASQLTPDKQIQPKSPKKLCYTISEDCTEDQTVNQKRLCALIPKRPHKSSERDTLQETKFVQRRHLSPVASATSKAHRESEQAADTTQQDWAKDNLAHVEHRQVNGSHMPKVCTDDDDQQHQAQNQLPQSTHGLIPPTPSSLKDSSIFLSKDALGPKIWTGTHFLPRFVRAAEVPGEGMCYWYDDGTYCKTVIDGEPVNAHWGVTEKGKPRKRLSIACITCREKKIKCDPDYPRCVQCEQFGRVCKFKNAPRGGNNEAPSTPALEAAEKHRQQRQTSFAAQINTQSQIVFSRDMAVPAKEWSGLPENIPPDLVQALKKQESPMNPGSKTRGGFKNKSQRTRHGMFTPSDDARSILSQHLRDFAARDPSSSLSLQVEKADAVRPNHVRTSSLPDADLHYLLNSTEGGRKLKQRMRVNGSMIHELRPGGGL